MKNIIRNQVEEVIKEQNLDRTRIFEVSKLKYTFIIQKIERNFVSYKWKEIHWSNMGHFNPCNPCYYKNIRDNWEWYHFLFYIIPSPEKPVYILLEDRKRYTAKYWLYEMYLPELVIIMDNIAYNDIYIISKKFEWLISENHEEIVALLGNKLNIFVFDK